MKKGDNEVLIISSHHANAVKNKRIHLFKGIIVPVGQTFTDVLPSVLNSFTALRTRLPTSESILLLSIGMTFKSVYNHWVSFMGWPVPPI